MKPSMLTGLLATLLAGAGGFLLVDALRRVLRGWLADLGHASYRKEAAG